MTFQVASETLAQAQRGEPEKAMLAIQFSQIAQLYGYVAEHAGDITNRMAQDPSFFRGGYGMVKEKVDRVHRILTDAYGFEREFVQQITTNLPFLEGKYASKAEALTELKRLGKNYAEAHKRLEPVNEAQRTARDLAVAIGEFRFRDAVDLVTELKDVTDQGGEAWSKFALERGVTTPEVPAVGEVVPEVKFSEEFEGVDEIVPLKERKVIPDEEIVDIQSLKRVGDTIAKTMGIEESFKWIPTSGGIGRGRFLPSTRGIEIAITDSDLRALPRREIQEAIIHELLHSFVKFSILQSPEMQALFKGRDSVPLGEVAKLSEEEFQKVLPFLQKGMALHKHGDDYFAEYDRFVDEILGGKSVLSEKFLEPKVPPTVTNPVGKALTGQETTGLLRLATTPNAQGLLPTGGSEIISDILLEDKGGVSDNLNNIDVTDKMISNAQKQIKRVTEASLDYRGLPDEFVVYRGGEIRGDIVPVTLDRSVAEQFAGFVAGKGKLQSWLVKKSDILADIEAFTGRFFTEGELLIHKDSLVSPITNPPPTGTCYEDAWRFFIKQAEGALVHGSLQLAEGPRVKHAWVELPGYVWEPQTGQYFTTEDFEILNPKEEARYTVEEAALMLVKVGQHGPWIGEEKQRLESKGNPGNDDYLPMSPSEGPPLPRALGIRWPWRK